MRSLLPILCLLAIPCLAQPAEGIHACATRGEVGRLESLLAANPGSVRARDPEGFEPLHRAVMAGQTEAATLFLARGADPNVPDPQGLAPLFRAVLADRPALVTALAKAGADLERPGPDGETPLFFAVTGRPGLVPLLLELGASPGGQGPDGESILHRAAEGGRPDVLRPLLARGARPGATFREGLTVLHVAAAHGHEAAVRLLAEAGAPLDARSRWWGTALQVAEAADHGALARVLRGLGAREMPREFPRLAGPYLGQALEAQARPFLPGLLGGPFRWTSAPSFSRDGRQVVWSAGEHQTRHRLWSMRLHRGVWEAPRVIPVSGGSHHSGPSLDPAGRLLAFSSDRGGGPPQVWMCSRSGEGWGEPRLLAPDPGRSQLYPTLGSGGEVVFQVIEEGKADLRSCLSGASPQPVKELNSPAWEAAPALGQDGQRIVFMSTRDGGPARFYASARRGAGAWGPPRRLGAPTGWVRNPGLSQDGKILFFVRGTQVWWMGADALFQEPPAAP